MTDTEQTHGDRPETDAAHGGLDHGATHMDAHATVSDDDHGHADVSLGPIDWGMWAYGVIGVAAGLLVVLFLWLAIS
jgi:hypothetical protein